MPRRDIAETFGVVMVAVGMVLVGAVMVVANRAAKVWPKK
jgi:high-affinity Fe2+/Pb2+ permease